MSTNTSYTQEAVLEDEQPTDLLSIEKSLSPVMYSILLIVYG